MGSRRCSEAGYLAGRAAPLARSPSRSFLCKYLYVRISKFTRSFTGGSFLAEVSKRAASGQQPARCERAGAQRVPCTGVLPVLAACTRCLCAWCGRGGNTHSKVTGLLCWREKGWAVWQHPCREMVRLRLGRRGWTLMSSVAPRVPGDAALPPALQTRAELRRHTGVCVPHLTPEKS